MFKTAKKAAAAAAMVTGLAATALLAGPTPAQAAFSDCRLGYVCLWQHNSYNGRIFMVRMDENIPNIGSYADMNDRTTSIWNRTTRNVEFFQDSNYRGYLFTFGPFHSSAAIQPQHNDRITSFRFA